MFNHSFPYVKAVLRWQQHLNNVGMLISVTSPPIVEVYTFFLFLICVDYSCSLFHGLVLLLMTPPSAYM